VIADATDERPTETLSHLKRLQELRRAAGHPEMTLQQLAALVLDALTAAAPTTMTTKGTAS
jgi:hypothetical protein